MSKWKPTTSHVCGHWFDEYNCDSASFMCYVREVCPGCGAILRMRDMRATSYRKVGCWPFRRVELLVHDGPPYFDRYADR